MHQNWENTFTANTWGIKQLKKKLKKPFASFYSDYNSASTFSYLFNLLLRVFEEGFARHDACIVEQQGHLEDKSLGASNIRSLLNKKSLLNEKQKLPSSSLTSPIWVLVVRAAFLTASLSDTSTCRGFTLTGCVIDQLIRFHFHFLTTSKHPQQIQTIWPVFWI